MNQSHARKMQIAPWALLAVSASWGYAFVVMKDAIEKQSVNSFLFSRFAVAVLAMIALKPSVLRNLNPDILKKGFLAGLFLGSGYIFQTLGLKLTGAAITGFITGLYVVATPVIAALFLRHKISKITWACVALATVGLALLSLHGWSVGFGELLVLISAIGFGAHIIASANGVAVSIAIPSLLFSSRPAHSSLELSQLAKAMKRQQIPLDGSLFSTPQLSVPRWLL